MIIFTSFIITRIRPCLGHLVSFPQTFRHYRTLIHLIYSELDNRLTLSILTDE